MHTSTSGLQLPSHLTMHAVLPTRNRYPTGCCVVDGEAEELVWFKEGRPAVFSGLVKAISMAPTAGGER